MAKIYAIVNQKGGVGKTTSVINLCAYLASSGQRVLMVDIDPQANATSGIGVDKTAVTASIYDLLLEEAPLNEVVQSLPEFKLDLIPSSPALSGAEVELVQAIGREYRLQKGLEGVNGRYDYVLIDCPPASASSPSTPLPPPATA
jgi:chromosome partitioning protein